MFTVTVLSRTSHCRNLLSAPAASATAALLLIYAPAAAAHNGAGVAGGFAAGLLHPISGANHLLAMVAVGIWGAFLGVPLLWVLPVAFPLMMVVGGILGIAGVALPSVEIGIALSVIVLGAAIAGAWRAPTPIAITIVAVFALFHGYAHGSELPRAAEPTAYATGFVITTGLLHIAGIAIGLLARLPKVARLGKGIALLRIGGVLIVAAGVWFLREAASFA
jgi:urease accessory protein